MAVAAAQASGSTDPGLGILAATNALELDFIPVTEERFDLVIPEVFLETAHITSCALSLRQILLISKVIPAFWGGNPFCFFLLFNTFKS